MRVPPFYSFRRGLALTDVWHDNDECPLGRSITPADRVRDTDDVRHRCAYCAMLDARPATPA